MTQDARLYEDRHDPRAEWGRVVGYLAYPHDHAAWLPHPCGFWVCGACALQCGRIPVEMDN